MIISFRIAFDDDGLFDGEVIGSNTMQGFVVRHDDSTGVFGCGREVDATAIASDGIDSDADGS